MTTSTKQPPWLPDAVKLYQQGYCQREVAAIVGVTKGVVARHLKLAGVTLRPRGGRRNWENILATAAKMHKAGVSIDAIADELGCSIEALRRDITAPPAERGPCCRQCDVRLEHPKVAHVAGHALCAWCELEARHARSGWVARREARA